MNPSLVATGIALGLLITGIPMVPTSVAPEAEPVDIPFVVPLVPSIGGGISGCLQNGGNEVNCTGEAANSCEFDNDGNATGLQFLGTATPNSNNVKDGDKNLVYPVIKVCRTINADANGNRYIAVEWKNFLTADTGTDCTGHCVLHGHNSGNHYDDKLDLTAATGQFVDAQPSESFTLENNAPCKPYSVTVQIAGSGGGIGGAVCPPPKRDINRGEFSGTSAHFNTWVYEDRSDLTPEYRIVLKVGSDGIGEIEFTFSDRFHDRVNAWPDHHHTSTTAATLTIASSGQLDIVVGG